MKYILILLLFLTSSCTLNKVKNNHGVLSLESKINKIEINKSNKNDIINLSGFAETGNNGWAFVENLDTTSGEKVLEVVSMSNPITPKLKSIKFKNNLLSGKSFTKADWVDSLGNDTNQAYYIADIDI